MRPRKFNFQKILMNGGDKKEDVKPLVSINTNGQMIINKAANHKHGFDQVLIDFRYDPEHRAFGWKKLNRLPENQWTKTMKLLKATKQGQVQVSIGRIFTKMGIPLIGYKSLPLDTYMDSLDGEIFYVILPKPPKEVTKSEVAELVDSKLE